MEIIVRVDRNPKIPRETYPKITNSLVEYLINLIENNGPISNYFDLDVYYHSHGRE